MSAGGSSEALQALRDPKRHVGPDLWPSIDPDEVVLDVLDDEVCIRLVRNAEGGVDRPLQGWPVYLARSDLVPVGRKEEIEVEDVTWLGLMPLCEGAEPAAEIVEVDVLGATAAAVEEPQVRSPLHRVVGDWQVGGHDLEQSQVEEFDQLRAFALFAHGLRLHE